MEKQTGYFSTPSPWSNSWVECVTRKMTAGKRAEVSTLESLDLLGDNNF